MEVDGAVSEPGFASAMLCAVSIPYGILLPVLDPFFGRSRKSVYNPVFIAAMESRKLRKAA
jgi:hypothetical protein